MRYILTALISVCAFIAQAQQVNPVPDYVFANRMSVGRNAVTDTSAYFSIGPRYGANKGFMPPIVGDTAHVTASNKRNGLLIFSVQKNKFLYWDSVRVQWSDMAGSSGSYIVAGDTATMLSPYVRHAGYGLTKSGQSFLVDTAAIATRARVQKGIDSVSSFVVKLTGNQTIAGNKTFSNDATFSGNINVFGALASFNELNTAYTSYLKSRASAVSQILYLPGDTGNLATERFVNSKFSSTVSGTTNYVPKITSGTVLGNSQIFDNGTNVGIGTTTPNSNFKLTINSGTNINSFYSGSKVSFSRTSDNAADIVYLSRTNDLGSNGTANIHGYDGIQFRTQGPESVKVIITDAGNVGIGTTNPVQPLQVEGTNGIGIGANGGAVYPVLRREGSTGGFTISSYNTSTLAYTENLRVQSTGNVGIGTAAPINKFSVFTGGDETANFTDLSGYASLVYRHRTTNAYRDGLIDAANLYINTESAGEVRIGSKTDAGDYKLQVSGNAYVTGTTVLAATSGNVGIKTPSPTTPLTVFNPTANGNILEVRGGGGSSQSRIIMNYGTETAITAENALIFSNTTEFSLRARSSRVISFYTDAGTESEKIKIHANGGLKFVGQSAAPTAEAGTVYYDTDDNKLKVYNGTTWVDLH
jgi:hypothetical protein